MRGPAFTVDLLGWADFRGFEAFRFVIEGFLHDALEENRCQGFTYT